MNFFIFLYIQNLVIYLIKWEKKLFLWMLFILDIDNGLYGLYVISLYVIYLYGNYMNNM